VHTEGVRQMRAQALQEFMGAVLAASEASGGLSRAVADFLGVASKLRLATAAAYEPRPSLVLLPSAQQAGGSMTNIKWRHLLSGLGRPC
jgi:hypothetical protein